MDNTLPTRKQGEESALKIAREIDPNAYILLIAICLWEEKFPASEKSNNA